MNPGSRKLLAAIVAQRMEMGEREWYFNPLPLLERGERLQPFDRVEREGRAMAGRRKTEEIADCTDECAAMDALDGKSTLDELEKAVQGSTLR